MILFSIIVPVYNTEKYIEKALYSVIDQDESNFEIIVVNDGSTDNSLQIIEKIARNDERIKVYNQKNKGVSCARNLGLDKAKGNYILFLDSDDELAPGALSNYYKIFQKKNPDIIEGNIINNKSQYRSKNKFKIKIFNHNKAIKYFLNFKTISGYAGGKAYNSSILKNIRFMPSVNYGEDGIFNYLVLQKNRYLVYANFDSYIYKIRENSLTGRNSSFGIKNLNIFKQINFILEKTSKSLEKYAYVFAFEMFRSEIEIYKRSKRDAKVKFNKEYKRMRKYCNKYWLYTLFVSINPRIKVNALKYFIGEK